MASLKVFGLLFLLVFTSCSHNISKYYNEEDIDYYKRVEELVEKIDNITIETIDENKYKVRELRINSDSTTFIDQSSQKFIVKSTKEIASLNFSQKWRGAFEGIMYGTLIGAGAGIAIGTGSQVVDSGGNPFNFFYSLIYSTITGAVGGMIYGYLNPGEIKIKLNENL